MELGRCRAWNATRKDAVGAAAAVVVVVVVVLLSPSSAGGATPGRRRTWAPCSEYFKLQLFCVIFCETGILICLITCFEDFLDLTKLGILARRPQ